MLELSIHTCIIIILLACVVEYIDSTVGMGYGTTLTPVLLMMGFDPIQIVPAILITELFTGVAAGIMHSIAGNVDFSIKTINPIKIAKSFTKYGLKESLKKGISQHLKMALLIGVFSIIGAVFGVIFSIKLPEFYLKLYIGLLIVTIGIYIIITYKRKFKFTWLKLMVISLIASFNKGVSGGGYGPVVTGGQILAGVNGKNAVAITSVAEALTCAIGIGTYYITGTAINWGLVPYLLIGGMLSIPLSVISVRKLRIENMKALIGVATLILGSFTLIKLF